VQAAAVLPAVHAAHHEDHHQWAAEHDQQEITVPTGTPAMARPTMRIAAANAYPGRLPRFTVSPFRGTS